MKEKVLEMRGYQRVIAVAIALLVIVSVLSYRFMTNVKRDLWSSTLNTIIEMTDQASNLVTGRLDAEENFLKVQASFLHDVNSTDVSQFDYTLSRIGTKESPAYVVIGDTTYPAHGTLKAADLKKNGRPLVPPHLSSLNGRRVISIFTEINFADGVQGYLVKEMSTNELRDAFSVTFFQNQGHPYLVNKDGDILMRSTTPKGNKTSKNIFTLLGENSKNDKATLDKAKAFVANGETGWAVFEYDKEENVYCFVPVDSTNWYMLSVVPKYVVDAQTDSILRETSILVLVILVGFMIMIGLLIYREHQNILKLQAENLVERKMLAASAREANNLILCANMENGSYRVIADSADHPIKFEDCESFEEVFEQVLALVDDEDRDEFKNRFTTAKLKQFFASGQKREYMELRINTHDGSHWIAAEATAVDAEDGLPRAVYTIKIIDEAKELEDKRRFMLQNALDMAEHANKAKTTFLNNMSHDIRTPMNAVIGFTALAAAHIDDKTAVQNYLDKISVSSKHLLSLINDVLDMSRIESGNVKVEENEVHLPDILHDLRTIIYSNIKAKQLDLFIDTQDVVHENILTDKLRLNQVLLNIASNAVKYTPAGGMISVRIIEKKCDNPAYGQFEFRIKDNGIGMSEDFQKHIFESFTREKSSTVSGIRGTGLGMALSKNIVDMMGGTITVKSEIDKGSEFIVSLRLKLSSRKVETVDPPELVGVRALVIDDDLNTCSSVTKMLTTMGLRTDWTTIGKEGVFRARFAVEQNDRYGVYIVDWMLPDMNGIEVVRRVRAVIGNDTPIIVLTSYDWADIEVEAREAGVTAFCSKPIFMSELREVLSAPFIKQKVKQEEAQESFKGKNILLVEDNKLNQEIAASILKMAGFNVDTAEDGTVAVDKVLTNPAGTYDVVLMDIQMPRMNGYEATKAIRELEEKAKADIPIIAVTADAFEEDRQKALDAGMNGHVTKPIEIPKLLETLAKILKKED